MALTNPSKLQHPNDADADVGAGAGAGAGMANNNNNFGRRLLPNIIDERARPGSGYTRPYAYIARSPDPNDGFTQVTYADLARAINRAAWWLVSDEVSAIVKEGEIFAYLGPNDLRYFVLSVAAIKTGRKILFASPRNTVQAQLALFDHVGCKAIVYGACIEKALGPLFAAVPAMPATVAPGQEDLLSEEDGNVPHYAYRETYETVVASEPLIYLHTSGSSGNPKPTAITVDGVMNGDMANIVPSEKGASNIKASMENQHHMCLLPPFHGAGFARAMDVIYYDGTAVIGHADVPPTPDYIVSLLGHGLISSLVAPPSILEGVSKHPHGIAQLSKLDHVGYAGGPLSQHVGSVLAPKLHHLYSLIGATEYGWFHTLVGPSSNWDSLRFNPDVGYRFDEVSEGIYELVVPNNPLTRKFHGTTKTFPELSEYRTKDLYSPAAEEGWMTYQGRTDDLIVLSNGEKINPGPLEDIISNHPAIKGAIIVGEFRFLPSLMIELEGGGSSHAEEQSHKLLESIWTRVEEANRHAPRFSRIPKALIFFTPPDKPFKRSGKGTIQRRLTVESFAKELEDLYASAEQGLLTDGLELHDPTNASSVKAMVRKIYADALGALDLSDEEDVFDRGMDSLQVTIAIQRLRAVLRAGKVDVDYNSVSPQLLYSCPNMDRLSKAISGLVSRKTNFQEAIQSTDSEEHVEKIQPLIKKYTKSLPPATGPPNASTRGKAHVVLTGSTGSLGSYLLAALQSSPGLAKVTCLNRSPDSEKRQRASYALRGLDASWDKSDEWEKVRFLVADLSQPELGLSKPEFNTLMHEATAIIHCSWKVDFNHSVGTFEKTHIAGVRHLIDLSARTKHRAPILFVSSVSTVLGWIETHPNQRVPESVLHDLKAPENLGYGQSKYVGERMIEASVASSGIPSAVLRVGQIAGPVLSSAGSWNQQEWFPSMIASSKHLGMLPLGLGTMNTVDWIPVDILARIIVQLLDAVVRSSDVGRSSDQTRETSTLTVYNLVNPTSVSWSSLLPTVRGRLGGDEPLRTVSLDEWVAALQKSAEQDFSGHLLWKNPAVKLLDFFKQLNRRGRDDTHEVMYEVGSVVRDSQDAAKLPAVSPEWVNLWMDQWKI